MVVAPATDAGRKAAADAVACDQPGGRLTGRLSRSGSSALAAIGEWLQHCVQNLMHRRRNAQFAAERDHFAGQPG